MDTRPGDWLQEISTGKSARDGHNWFDLSATDVLVGLADEGYWITVADRPDWAEDGAPSVNLRLSSFASLAHAIRAAHCLYGYAKAEGLTRAWIADF